MINYARRLINHETQPADAHLTTIEEEDTDIEDVGQAKVGLPIIIMRTRRKFMKSNSKLNTKFQLKQHLIGVK